MKIKAFSLLVLFFLTLLVVPAVRAQSDLPVIRAVLFYSPTCPHCHKVMTEDLPPIQEKYGEQLQILEVNVTEQKGAELYQLAIATFNIPQNRLGVPAMFIDQTLLVGDVEIPTQLPVMIETGLQQGGIDWPAIPGLSPFVEAYGTGGATSVAQMTAGERFALDPVGNTLSVIVLAGLAVVLFLAGYAFMNRIKLNPWPQWVLPVLVVVGMGVAGYLTFIETTNTEAVCGPVGDCNTVQQSEYARLFGFLPVGVLGLIGYVAIGIAWFMKNNAVEKTAKQGALALWSMALAGTVFSIYLTFLEPFVIGATCIWCLSSAIIMGTVLWASTPLALQAVARKHRVRAGHA
ncbi:MAG TPA: vitamin K epoxide reductase family protein [Anaerolineales bacterium]|nr:vitamin K epoxide reductase family protein [Anaerolineales bacterium]